MSMIKPIFILLLFQLAGEALRAATHTQVPGPVIGMILLAAFYILRRREPSPALEHAADGLLSWLGLLFVPAGVGIVANIALIRSAWLPISVALIASTFITLITTAWIMHRFGNRASIPKEGR
ncbi:MAG: CidA/LrgA family protein [Acidobacteriaceae bacterium]|jgi:holin-like protein